ncbi:carbohydrate-binding protein [Saccharophagus degradans]|uniref:Carbohydrate-binding protein n=1 Tax=Saccharophagus degradans TaxID=86304 RepID=A0AAW7X608_9GAMM|nr:carbohydrate-binding protein [Saccharophagus degradans]MDO6423285.1 carbohydrate-binding protein [Saccharophagus degradans]MDO6606690.1 carbohydrate-binding protein [Saccharophagus degradans]
MLRIHFTLPNLDCVLPQKHIFKTILSASIWIGLCVLIGGNVNASTQEINGNQLKVTCQSESFCDIHYRLNSGHELNLPMDSLGNGSYQYIISGLSSGDIVSYSLTYQQNDLAYNSEQMIYVFGASTSAGPYLGFNARIPGIILAENYDTGGEGMAYHDTTAGNSGDQYRAESVDIESASIGGFNVGWIAPGEWLQYSVDVANEGSFNIVSQIASLESGGSLHYEISGATNVQSEKVQFTKTGGWQTWEHTAAANVHLNAGFHTLRIVFETAGFNIHSLIVSEASYGKIEAESFDSMSGIAADTTSVGYFDSGDWVKYNAVNFGNLAKSITLSIAGAYSNGVAELRLGSTSGPVIATYSMMPTDGWADFQPRSFNITHTSGVHDLYIVGKSGNGIFNLDYFQLSSSVVEETTPNTTINAMSLNVYGWATMPQFADDYAALIRSRDVDVVGIQEGVEDWNIGSDFPTNYSKANALGAALGECWEQRYQIFINLCKGNSFISNRRFDMTDGPNATRTGESARISKNGFEYAALTVHWDHQSGAAKIANAHETAAEVNYYGALPTVVVGDFNTGCTSHEVNTLNNEAGMTLIGNAGIDCILAKRFTGTAQIFDAAPSDHPSLDAVLSTN